MPILGQPDTSIYGQTQLWNAPGLAPQGRAGAAAAGPTAAQMKFGADQQVEQDINALAQQYGDDYDGLVKAVTSVHPDRGLAMGKALEEYRQNAAKTDVENNNVAVSKIDLGTRWLQEAIEDPSKYPVVRARVVSAGGPSIDQILPPVDDPDLQNKLVGVVSAAQPTKDYLETRTKAMQSYMDGNKVDGTLTLLAGSKTPAQWDASTKIVKMGGMGQLLQGIPDAASAQQMLADRQATKPQKTGTEKGLQSEDVYIPGKGSVKAVFDPNTGKYLWNGQDVTAVARRVPPASSGGGGGGGGSSLSAGEGGGLELAGTWARLTSRVPVGFSRGNNPAAITNEAARQIKMLGQTPVVAMQKAAIYQGDQKALANLQKMHGASDAYETKATAQLDIVDGLSDSVWRTKSPLINKAILAGQTEIVGDKDATLLLNAIQTASAEYAKIMMGGTGSAAAITDSAQKEAQKLVNAGMSKGTLKAATALMRQEMGLTMKGYDVAEQHIVENMGKAAGAPAAAPEQTGTAPPSVTAALQGKPPNSPGKAYTLSDGSRWVKAADGSISKAP